MKVRKNKIELLDCTLRDGGYINNWNFDRKTIREVYRSLSRSGVDYIELGYRNKKNAGSEQGICYFTTDDDIYDITDGIYGSKIAVMVDYKNISISDFLKKSESKIDMVRVASNKRDIEGSLTLCEKLKGKGYITSIQCMGATNYSKEEINILAKKLKKTNVDYVYIADTYGSIMPANMKELILPFIDQNKFKVGFHPHNSLEMAFANTIEAICLGCNIIDGSAYGMGRAAGNLPIETLIAYLQTSGDEKYNVIPILGLIDRYFVGLKKKYNWGYQLPYMLSGIFKLHPNYASEMINQEEFSIDKIWEGLGIIKSTNPEGFSKEILSKVIYGNSTKNLSVKTSVKSNNALYAKPAYIDRHKGEDILVLANGPTLKSYKSKLDKFIKKFNPIVIGANNLNGLFVPDYHAFNNEKRFIDYIDTVNTESRILLGRSISESLINDYMSRTYEHIEFNDRLDKKFSIKDGIISTNCRTISVLLLAVSVVMGASRIFAAGLDGYLTVGKNEKHLFYNEKVEPNDKESILERHRWNEYFMKKIDACFIKKGGEGITIITPTSYKMFYKSITNYI